MLLKVMICLPKLDVDGEISGVKIKDVGGQIGIGERGAQEREQATVIGSLTLSAIPEAFRQAATTTVGLCIGEAYQNKVVFDPFSASTQSRELGLRNTELTSDE